MPKRSKRTVVDAYASKLEKADKKYKKLRQKIEDEFEAVIGPERTRYQKIRAAAYKKYNKAISEFERELNEKIDPASNEYNTIFKAAQDIRKSKLRAINKARSKVKKDALAKLQIVKMFSVIVPELP